MGDRGNIAIKQNDDTCIYLYTHWRGSSVCGILAKALDSEKGRNRWRDRAYLTRIIFDTLTEGYQNEETGFGIDTEPCDNQHDIPVVTVPQCGQGFAYVTYRGMQYPFESFILQFRHGDNEYDD
jgi:hypothetical protein